VTRLGVVMTPTAGRAITDGGFAGGMIITASHNPREWNGLKSWMSWALRRIRLARPESRRSARPARSVRVRPMGAAR
jgi:hypothetical protein